MLSFVAVKELSDFVRETLQARKLSTYDVAKRSGNMISAATVTKIINREIRSNSVHTLDALAVGLGVDRDELYNIVRGLPANPSRFEIYAERFNAADLTNADWEQLETYFQNAVDQWKALKAAAGNVKGRRQKEKEK